MTKPLLAHVDENAKCHFANKLAAVAAFGQLKGKDILIFIEERQDWKTYLQLGYWFGYAVKVARLGWIDLGEYMDEASTHLRLMDELMRFPIVDERTKEPICNKKTGEIRMETRTMSTMTMKEMMELIPRMQQFCAENLFVNVEDPDKDWRAKQRKANAKILPNK